MMIIAFDEVLDLYEMVNFGSPFSHEGYICKSSGKTYYYSEHGDNEEELPDDIDSKNYIAIPSKTDLDLGNSLAFEFTAEFLPSNYDKVRSIFQGKGAYGRFKELLDDNGVLEDWFKFEQERTEKALREWCSLQELEISG
ncbi:UPF0158 family protein [Vibrio amylolyticus]|uniref:UPF0158 family protein n=1 Tax=Vibrio amylolyticus TaxID=2847292 RepID=UPI00354C3D74